MRVKRLMIGLAATAAAITGTVVAAPAASAAVVHGCPNFDFCFYFNSDFEGAHADYFNSDGNLDNELFNKVGTSRNGLGVQVKNNAASVYNNWDRSATVYFNSGCNGSVASQAFAGFSGGNLNSTMKNNNASFKWPFAPGTNGDCANRDQF